MDKPKIYFASSLIFNVIFYLGPLTIFFEFPRFLFDHPSDYYFAILVIISAGLIILSLFFGLWLWFWKQRRNPWIMLGIFFNLGTVIVIIIYLSQRFFIGPELCRLGSDLVPCPVININ